MYRVTREKEGEKKPTRYFSSKQEKQVAKNLGGKVNANSGATAYVKGDVQLEDFLIECKTKTSPSESFSIKKEWIEKNVHESVYMGKKYSALAFNFEPNGKMYYVIDEYTFQELLQGLNTDK